MTHGRIPCRGSRLCYKGSAGHGRGSAIGVPCVRRKERRGRKRVNHGPLKNRGCHVTLGGIPGSLLGHGRDKALGPRGKGVSRLRLGTRKIGNRGLQRRGPVGNRG